MFLKLSKLVEKEISKARKNREQLKKIMRYLDENHSRQVTVQETAGQFGYNPDYLSRMLKKQIGLTAMEYLYEVRMNHIHRDLLNTADYVNEIFQRHGCTKYKVAMRLFKERYKCTPTQARKEKNNQIEIIVNTEKDKLI